MIYSRSIKFNDKENASMIKDDILKMLKKHRKDLTSFAVKSLYIFGSVARGEETPQSDIDMLVVFEGCATFGRYMELKFFLEDLFQKKVDLITEEGLRPELAKSVKQDLIRAA